MSTTATATIPGRRARARVPPHMRYGAFSPQGISALRRRMQNIHATASTAIETTNNRRGLGSSVGYLSSAYRAKRGGASNATKLIASCAGVPKYSRVVKPSVSWDRSIGCFGGLTDRASAAARCKKIHSIIYARRQLQALWPQRHGIVQLS